MEHSVLIVEPDLQRRREVGRLLIQSGYDALVASCTDEALRQLYQMQPDAVVLSDRLPAADLDMLSDAVATMSDLPLVELTDGLPLALVAQRLTRSVGVEELVETLNELFGAT